MATTEEIQAQCHKGILIHVAQADEDNTYWWAWVQDKSLVHGNDWPKILDAVEDWLKYQRASDELVGYRPYIQFIVESREDAERRVEANIGKEHTVAVFQGRGKDARSCFSYNPKEGELINDNE